MDLIQMSLEKRIEKAQKAYYAGNPIMEDKEFDELWDRLQMEYPDSTLLRGVGSDLGETDERGKKGKHYMVMGSQDKFNNPDDFIKWVNDEGIQFPVIASMKIDGISVELQYLKGELICALTRGDGYVGENITSAVKKMQGVPLSGVRCVTCDEMFTGSVRGEIVMDRDVFDKKYSDVFKNPRNFVAGAVKNEKFFGYQDIKVISYDIYTSQNSYMEMSREDRKLFFLSKNRFIVVDAWECRKPEEVIEVWKNKNPRSFAYNADGLVIKQMVVDFNDSKLLRPKKQHAFKWIDEGEVTTLLDIEWSRSGSTYTPVALLEPVDIDGSTVSRASLSNPSYIESMKLVKGCRVLVTKRGMIIPKIEKVVNYPNGEQVPFEVPSVCEICGSPLEIRDSALVCSNPKCKGRKEHQISKWVQVLDVKGMGTSLQKELIEKGINSIPDLYDRAMMEGFVADHKSKRKAYADFLEKSKHVTLSQFIAGFDIDGIGTELAENIVNAGYNTLEKVLMLSEEELEKIENWSSVRAFAFLEGLDENRDDMLMVKEHVGLIEGNTPNVLADSPISGKHVCVTGKLENFSRKGIEDFIKEHGGISDSGVTSKTDILVTNDRESGSSKLRNAEKYGTEIMSESEFMDMVGGN